MAWTDLLYLTERRAQAYGFTHHGTIFGVPCWLKPDDPDTLVACPKVTLLQFYCLLMDTVFESISIFLPEDWALETPHSVGKPIQVNLDA
jgi:hypothetical protein